MIACGYEMQHGLKDLVPLKAFLLAGTTVTVMEEKVGPSALPTPDALSPTPRWPLSLPRGQAPGGHSLFPSLLTPGHALPPRSCLGP